MILCSPVGKMTTHKLRLTSIKKSPWVCTEQVKLQNGVLLKGLHRSRSRRSVDAVIDDTVNNKHDYNLVLIYLVAQLQECLINVLLIYSSRITVPMKSSCVSAAASKLHVDHPICPASNIRQTVNSGTGENSTRTLFIGNDYPSVCPSTSVS